MAKKTAKTTKSVVKKKSTITAKKRMAHRKNVAAASASYENASQEIDAQIEQLGDWRGKTLARLRELIHKAQPDVVEQIKWRRPTNNMTGVPVWSAGGILCTGETYKDKIKLTFPKGASLEDPAGLFNASLTGNARRAIDFQEGYKVDAKSFQALVRAAAALNQPAATSTKPTVKKSSAKKSGAKPASNAKPSSKAKPSGNAKPAKQPKLLSGGNPQIAKADGDAPVQEFIAAMPGWKSAVGRQLDELIVRTIPSVLKAVRWNSPFYGIEGQGWFLAFHCFNKYIKLTFLNGSQLRPLPPIESKHAATRYFHIYENDTLDEVQLTDWLLQAAELPGERLF